jgi:hypothetical protein
MSRRSELVVVGEQSIETYVDGAGPAVVIIPSYGRDSGDDFEPFAAAQPSREGRRGRSCGQGLGYADGVQFDRVLSE